MKRMQEEHEGHATSPRDAKNAETGQSAQQRRKQRYKEMARAKSDD